MEEVEVTIGDYIVEAKALYVADKNKWRTILRISRCSHGRRYSPMHQDFNQLPAISGTEADALQYGLARGRALIEGNVIGLTI